MRLTASEYAARKGLTPRAVRFQLQKGKLPGWKEMDSETGVETWYVEVSDGEENATTPQEKIGNLLPGVAEIVSILQSQHQEQVARLHRENLELAGRVGFYQARIQELERRVLELEAPKQGPAETATHPAHVENGPNSGAEKASERPWWKFW